VTAQSKLEKETDKLTNKLLELLGIEASVNIEKIKQEDSSEVALHVEIDAQTESGLLIGAHGATLNAIQSFLALALKQKTGEWARINLDVGQWRQRHEEYLAELAHQAAERARSTGEPQHLYNLTPAQRRIVHLALSRQKDISTESLGEGENRYLIVKPS
jgi:spoIIIJ-associated protein